MKTSLLVSVLAAIGILVGAPAVWASDVHVDHRFGSDGIAFLPRHLPDSSGIAILGDGGVAIGGEQSITALLPDGRIDPGFGDAGVATLASPDGKQAEALAIAVDPSGRPVAVGLASGEAGTESGGGAPTEPFVERFTPAGLPDPSFGSGTGYLRSSFGLSGPYTGGVLQQVDSTPPGTSSPRESRGSDREADHSSCGLAKREPPMPPSATMDSGSSRS